MKRIITFLLTLTLICGCAVFSGAATVMADTDPQDGDNANSWRYENGRLMQSLLRTNGSTTASHPDATLVGIDVSHHQGEINWEKVKADGIDFAILRCGYGANQTKWDDRCFEYNASECERLGITYGVYLYSYANNTVDAESEADHVLRLLKGRTLSYPVYYDMEDKSTLVGGTKKEQAANLATFAKIFCNKVSKAGYPVGVYANTNWWNNYLTDKCFDQWHRWVAQYNIECTYKGEYGIWQYTSDGSVNGINGRVDMNYQIGYPADHGVHFVDMAEGTYTITHKADDSLMGIKDSSMDDKAIAVLESSEDLSSNNRFELLDLGANEYLIRLEHSGKALTATSDYADTFVRQDIWNNSDSQIWYFVYAGSDTCILKNKVNTYLKIDSNGVLTTTENVKEAAQWKVTMTAEQPVADGLYNIVFAADKKLALDVKDAGTELRANVELNENDNSISQQYQIKHAGNGYYTINAEHSNLTLDVNNGSKEPGANLHQYRINGNRSQLWKFVEAENGSWYIKSKLGTAIDAASESAAVGTNINMQLMETGPDQKWLLTPVETKIIEDGWYMLRNVDNKNVYVTLKDETVTADKNRDLLNQKFHIQYAETGTYTMTDALSEATWTIDGSHMWRFIQDETSGGYFIKSGSGKFIAANQGENVINLDTSIGRIGHTWLLEKTEPTHQHDIQLVDAVKATCTEPGCIAHYKCARCEKVYRDLDGNVELSESEVKIAATGHNFEWIIDKEAAYKENGIKHEECTYCNLKRNENTEFERDVLFEGSTALRLAGIHRYDTSILCSDSLKMQMGLEEYKNIVVASGEDYPDALAGSYLAKVKDAPILLTSPVMDELTAEYIKYNLKADGTVYILGGTGVVSAELEEMLADKNIKAERLAGKTRYETNIAILEEAGVKDEDILVCSGNGFADSLSASAVGLPIMLVNTEITEYQQEYLAALDTQNIYLIGGEGAVNEDVEQHLNKGYNVQRLAGKTRYVTSALVAKEFFPKANNVVLAYAQNFPDGLSGGPLAMSLDAPLLLVDNNSYNDTAKYVSDAGAIRTVILGGPTLISDKVVNAILSN